MHEAKPPLTRAAYHPKPPADSDNLTTLSRSSFVGDLLTRDQVRLLLAEATAREVFDTEGAADYLGVSRQLLELMRVEGGGPKYAKLNRLVRYRRAALDDWLIGRERSHTSERSQ